MGRDVYETSAAAREVFAAADSVVGFSLSRLCFEGPEDELVRTENQQPAILTTSIALLRALEEQGPVEAGLMAGHSLGEYSALVARPWSRSAVTRSLGRPARWWRPPTTTHPSRR
jgi:[acyl-carrier-protein] S-malonyltransferase